METKQQLESKATTMLGGTGQSDTTIAQFCLLWSEIIRPALGLLKVFTGPQIDMQIEKLETTAESICNGTANSITDYCQYWKILQVKSLLKMVQIFTGPKVDMIIDKFINISDSLCEEATC